MAYLFRWLTRDLSVRIIALFVAGFLWSLAVLDRTYNVRVTVPVTPVRPDAKQVIIDTDVKHAVVTLEGKGRDLLGVRPRTLEFRLAIHDAKVGTRQLQLSPTGLKLPPEVRVRALDPDKVELHATAAVTRLVGVQVPTRGQAGAGITLSVNEPPAQVKLSGTAEDVKLAPMVTTETLDLATVTAPGRRRLRVLVPEDGQYAVEPESVDVVIALEKEAARIFLGVPVKVVSPRVQAVEIEPEEAQIAVAGPGSKMGTLKKDAITAQVRVSGLAPGNYRLAAEILLPPEFHLVKCEPQFFDVTVK